MGTLNKILMTIAALSIPFIPFGIIFGAILEIWWVAVLCIIVMSIGTLSLLVAFIALVIKEIWE